MFLPRATMGIKRFKAICAFLHIIDPENEGDISDRLCKVNFLVTKFKYVSRELYRL